MNQEIMTNQEIEKLKIKIMKLETELHRAKELLIEKQLLKKLKSYRV